MLGESVVGRRKGEWLRGSCSWVGLATSLLEMGEKARLVADYLSPRQAFEISSYKILTSLLDFLCPSSLLSDARFLVSPGLQG